jgi:hypothetical protein
LLARSEKGFPQHLDEDGLCGLRLGFELGFQGITRRRRVVFDQGMGLANLVLQPCRRLQLVNRLFDDLVQRVGGMAQKNAGTDGHHEQRDENDPHGDHKAGPQRQIRESEEIHPVQSLGCAHAKRPWHWPVSF